MSEAKTEAAETVDFNHIRYAQVWEDADILLDALNIREGSTCVSICSAGDNALAMLIRNPARVYAVDLNPAQLHCLRLRIAAFRCLNHGELLELIGSRESRRRERLYARCRSDLADDARAFWDCMPEQIRAGIGNAGKFEHYFRIFRSWILPLVHSSSRVDALLQSRNRDERMHFYDRKWNHWRWRLLFRLFFSRTVMGRLGRDPALFKYVEGSVGSRILERTRHALTKLDTVDNPYLQWILKGRHTSALPLYLREEHFETIRKNSDRIEPKLCTLEELCEELPEGTISAFNLSDLFEYMSEANTEALLSRLLRVSGQGCRFAYWNMLAPRSRPPSLADRLRPIDDLAKRLFNQDKAFFYSRFVVEEVMQ